MVAKLRSKQTPMMRTTTSADPGLDTPLGRYRLMALLGQGGMADVYLACTQGAGGFQKLLVVKLARFTGDPLFATMFLSEARLAAQLSHPNVVHTYEIGEEGTRHYIVMEYLDGGNLSRLRQKMVPHGGIPLRISLHILLQVLEGLEYAHEAEGLDGRLLKVVHRDLSPSNIMVTAQGVVKILDFGIAKAADSHSYTQTGRFSGKLEYMPPEQLRGASVDQRADIFSFGVMLAESFLGHKLWGNATGPQIAVELGQGKLPSLEQGTDVDPGLRQICQRALAPDPENRYATAGELKADLAAYVATLGKPVSQRELADFVRKTLEDDRAKLQLVIDSQLQKLSFLAWGGETPPPDLPRLEHTPSGGPIPEETVIEDSGQVQIITKNPALPPAPKRKSPVKWMVVGGAAITVLAIALFVAVSGTSSPKSQPAPETALPALPLPAAPPAPTSVRLEVVASPSDATITFDGNAVGGNPYVASVPRDLTGHVIVVRAPGYVTLTQQVTLDRDLNFRLSLQREPVAAVAPAESVMVAKPGSKRSVTRGRTYPAKTTGPAVVEQVVATPAPTPAVDARRVLDTNVLEKQPTKRNLDTNVLEDKTQKKPTLDRGNLWKN